jgi:type I restriction enzyme S subunit
MLLRPYPSYRQTDLPWLGQIPAHWDVKRLKQVANVMFSSVDKHSNEDEKLVSLCNYVDVYKNEQITSGIEFMQATASAEEIKRFTLKRDDVIITKDSESWNDIAIPAYVPNNLEHVLCGYHLALIRPKRNEVDGKFLFRALQARPINYQFEVEATGITRYGIDQYAIGSTFFPIPPLPEQRAIAAYLDHQTAKIDALIAKKRRLLDLLAEKRAALISQAVTKGLNPDVEMKDSGVPWLGQVPRHWDIKRIAYLFRERDERNRANLPLLNVSIHTGVSIRQLSDNHVEQMAEDFSVYKVAYENDIAFNKMRMWQGAVGRVPTNGLVSPDYVVATATVDIDTKYYGHLFKNAAFSAETARYSHGIVWDRLRLYWEEFRSIFVPIPPLDEQHDIVNYITRESEKLDKLAMKIETAIERLREYRAALISSAVTGKIQVKDEG